VRTDAVEQAKREAARVAMMPTPDTVKPQAVG
jgi:hypothetical protein